MPIDKGTSKPITQLSGLQINYKDEYSCFNPPIVTTAERDALVNTDDPKQPIKDGTTVFNSDTGYQEYYSGDKWIQIKDNAGGGDVSGPVNATDNNIAVFDGTTGKKIKDGGLAIAVLQQAKKGKALKATPLYKLSNLGALQFGSNDNVADTGTILVDGLTPVTFQTQGTGAEARVCSVINGELGAGSSSPSALLEINSSEGAFLPSRLTTGQRDALPDPKDGLICYNTDSNKLNVRESGLWVEYNIGQNGTLPIIFINNDYSPSLKDDCIISVSRQFTPSPIAVTLPSYTAKDEGKIFIISDMEGRSDIAPITVVGVINNKQNYTVSSKYGFVVLYAGAQGWVIIGQSGSGNVIGPTTSALNSLAVWDNNQGTNIKDSGIIINNNTEMANITKISGVNNKAILTESLNIQHYFTTSQIRIIDPAQDITGTRGVLTLSVTNAPGSSTSSISFVGETGGLHTLAFPDDGDGTFFRLPFNNATADGQILTSLGTGTTWASKNQLSYSKVNEGSNAPKIFSKDKHIAGVNTSSNEQKIILDKLSVNEQGYYFTIKDETGNASKNNIIVDGNGVLIDGRQQYIINTDYGCITVCYTGSSWSIIAKF